LNSSMRGTARRAAADAELNAANNRRLIVLAGVAPG
jgi:hypothetical protein